MVITGFVELVELVNAAVVGAWVYKEEEAKAETPASRRAVA